MSDELLSEYYATSYAAITESSIGTPCLVCGETVPIRHHRDVSKICDKCKAAIMAMREQMGGERREDGTQI